MYEYIIIKTNVPAFREGSDVYSKQQIYALAVYLMKNSSLTLKIILDRPIGAPCHGKAVVDGLNMIDKRHLG